MKHFAFYYINKCPVHEEAKYGASYWPQKPSFEQFKSAAEENKQNRLYYGKDMHRNNKPKNLKRTTNPYLSTDYNSLYNFNSKRKRLLVTENAKIKNYVV